MTNVISNLMTVDQVAEYCQMSPSTVYHWICEGKLRSVKLGNAVRVRRQDLERYVVQRLRGRGKGEFGEQAEPSAA